jgi:hypothetical protein
MSYAVYLTREVFPLGCCRSISASRAWCGATIEGRDLATSKRRIVLMLGVVSPA